MRPRSPRKPKEKPCLPRVQRRSSERLQVERGHREPVLLPMLKKPETDTPSSALYPGGCQIFTPKSLTFGTPGGTNLLLCSRWAPTGRYLVTPSEAGSKRLIGIWLPENGWPVSGSVMTVALPRGLFGLAVSTLEKSPRRLAAVGTNALRPP